MSHRSRQKGGENSRPSNFSPSPIEFNLPDPDDLEVMIGQITSVDKAKPSSTPAEKKKLRTLVRQFRKSKRAGLFIEKGFKPGGIMVSVIEPDAAFSRHSSVTKRTGLGSSAISPETLAKWLPKGKHPATPEAEIQPVEVDPEMDPDVAEAVKRARVRGAERAAEILSQSDILSGEEMSKIMGKSRQAVHKDLQNGRLLAISGGKRANGYPAWQLDGTGSPLQGLSEVIALLGNGWPAYRFLAAPHRDGGTRFERLASGEVAGVVDEARSAASGDFG